MELFAQRPVSEVTVDEIASQAGVAVRTIYRYFPTKDGILLAFPRRRLERLSGRIRQRPESESASTVLRNALLAGDDEVERTEVERWLAALVHSESVEHLSKLAFSMTAASLGDAFADRAGLAPDELWPSMAGAIAAAAFDVAARQWAARGGELLEHELVAIEIAERGLGQPTPSAAEPES